MFDAQLFLQRHSVPHREHRLTYKKQALGSYDRAS